MRRVFLLLLAPSLLAAGGIGQTSPALAVGDDPSHLNVPTDQIVNLQSAVVARNDVPSGFFYDRNGLAPFGPVPPGFSFVITDISIVPEGRPISADGRFLVLITTGDARSFVSRFVGASQTYHLTAGLVVPEEQSVTARNTSLSTNPVQVQLLGYFVRGAGLPVGSPIIQEPGFSQP